MRSITRRGALPALMTVTGLLAVASPAAAAAPANDDIAAAAKIGALPASVAGSLAEATRERGEPDHGDRSVWYAFTATAGGPVAVEDDFALGEGTSLAVYVRDAAGALEPVGSSMYGSMRVTFDAVAGETYLIAVASRWELTDASFSLRVRAQAPPANDAFEDAKVLWIPGRYKGTVLDASAELGEPAHGGPAQHSVWYRITPLRTGKLTLEATSATSPTALAVYRGSEVSALRRVGAAANRPLRFVATRGRTYHVAVDIPHYAGGEFSLDVSDGSIAGKGVALSIAPDQTVDGVRARGLRMVVSTRRKVTVGIELRVSRRTARRLELPSQVLGRTRGTLRPGQKLPATIRLSAAARRALAYEFELRATARLTLLNSSAPNRTLEVPVRLDD